MFSSKKAEAFPAVPPTLSADNADFPYTDNNNTAVPYTLPQYTPYLGLRARLSQVWINKWTVLLLLVLCRVLLAVKNLDQHIANARTDALSACTKVEDIGSAFASMPHYLSVGVNDLAADGVTKAVNGLLDMLSLTVTGVENLVLFVINMLTSTYVCLITLVISGSLNVAIDMIEKVGAFMNQTIDTITGDIATDVTDFTNTLNKFLSGLGDITGFFGGSSTPPKIDISSQLTQLQTIQIDPTKLDSDLETLRSNIPTFADVQNFTNNIISLPFEAIKQEINSSLATYTFDRSVFPTAPKQALTFCSDNNSIATFFTGLTTITHLAKKIFLAVIVILAVLACIPMAYREVWRWRTMQTRALLLQKHAFDPIDVIYIASRPYTSTAGIKAASRFKSPKRQILARWAISYGTSVPALFVLVLGLAGLFSCLCQYILLRTIEKEVPALSEEVGDFASTVVNALNNASEQWALAANGVIESTGSNINNDLLGWAVTSTKAVNDTLNTFMTDINTAINATFGGTILLAPVQDTLSCLLGLKVAAVERGLTWVHDNAHVTFPEFKNDTFSLGAAASLTNSSEAGSFLASPGSVAADDVTSAVQDMVNILTNALQEEAIIAAVLVGTWAFILLIGVLRACVGMLGRDKTRGEGGAYTGEHRLPLSPRSPDLKGGQRFEGGGAAVPMTTFNEKKGGRGSSDDNDEYDDGHHVGDHHANGSSKFGMFGASASEVGHVADREAWVRKAVGEDGNGSASNGGEKVTGMGRFGRKVGVVERRGHERESSYGVIGGGDGRGGVGEKGGRVV